MGIPVSSSQKAALGKQIGCCNDERNNGGEPGQSPSLSVRSLVRWLEVCSEIDTHLLWNVQRYLTGRLDKSFGIRDLFAEISAGRRHVTPKHLTKVLKGTKAQLSRVVIELLIGMFDDDGDGSLSFSEFQKLVYAEGALRDSSGMLCSSHPNSTMRSLSSSNHWDYTADGLLWGDNNFSRGGGPGKTDRQAWVDKEIYQIFIRALEKAFMFYDEDNSNTIEVMEIGNILRALGQDPTQKDVRALVRHADKDRNGVLSFNEFKDAVMPFIMEKVATRRLTDAEVHATFNSIDCDNSGSISRKEFQDAFVTQLKVLSPLEAETLSNLCDQDGDGFISWEEFAEFFQLIEDPDGTLPALIKAEVKGIVHIALMKLFIGAQHDPEDYLLAFLGMPSNFRRSILAGLDLRKEFQLSSLLMPVFDSRGGISMPDAIIKVTTTVTEKSTPVGQSSTAQKGLVSSGSTFRAISNKWWKSPKRMAGRKEFGSPVNHSPRHQEMALHRSGGLSSPFSFERTTNLSQGHSKKVTKRSTFISQGQQLTETNVMRSASLQSSYDVESDDIMQVMISVKRGTGIPVPQDSRIKDVLRRSLRVCLVYIPPKEVDGGDSPPPELEDLCFGNTYQTLARQDPDREEIWNFPNGPDGERKFLVRTDFTSPDDPKARENVCVLLELTCTIGTEKTQPDDDNDCIRGPLKQFKALKRTNAVESDTASRSDADSGSDLSDADNNCIVNNKIGTSYEQLSPHSDSSKMQKRRHRYGKREKRRHWNNNSDYEDDDGTIHHLETESESDMVFDEGRHVVETEMSCGWVMLPLLELCKNNNDSSQETSAEGTNSKRQHLYYKLQGGTPFSRSKIVPDEVMTRRYGWRAMLKAMKLDGLNKTSELEIKVIPVSRLPQDCREDVLRLPLNVVVADGFVPLVRYYREYAAGVLAMHSNNRTRGAAGYGCIGAISEPILALFPRIAADPTLRLALKELWEVQKTKHGSGLEGKKKTFEFCVMRMWPAVSSMGARRNKKHCLHESMESQEARVAIVRKLVASTDSFRGDTPTNAYQKRQKGTEQKPQLCVAFTTKEVTFDAA